MINPISAVKNVPNWVWLSGAAVVVLYVLKSGGLQGASAGVVSGLIGGMGKIITGAATGLVGGVHGLTVGAVSNLGRGVGETIRGAIGAPPLNIIKCKLAIARADNGEAYTYCEPEVFSRWQLLSIRKKLTGKTFTMSEIFN